jgi:hypothetical protein
MVVLHLGERIERRRQLGDDEPQQSKGDRIQHPSPRCHPDRHRQRNQKQQPGQRLRRQPGEGRKIGIDIQMERQKQRRRVSRPHKWLRQPIIPRRQDGGRERLRRLRSLQPQEPRGRQNTGQHRYQRTAQPTRQPLPYSFEEEHIEQQQNREDSRRRFRQQCKRQRHKIDPVRRSRGYCAKRKSAPTQPSVQ